MNTEMVILVDLNNQPIGEAPRSVMRRDGLRHRVTYILVFNPAGQILLQKRTASKDLYPGYFDAAAGGVVQCGESYMRSAQRELAEELGVVDTPLVTHFDHYFDDGQNRCWGRVFSCLHDGPFTLQAAEVDGAEFVDCQAVLHQQFQPLTPDTFEVLQRWSEFAPGSRDLA